MRARLASLAQKAARYGVAWATIKASFAAGVVTGMLVMAIAMAGLVNSPRAAEQLRAQVEALR